MNITGTFSLKCDKCGVTKSFLATDADFQISSSEERSQGVELCHNWEYEFDCDNNKCDNNIEINYSVYEYPINVFNLDEVLIERGTETTRYQYNFKQ